MWASIFAAVLPIFTDLYSWIRSFFRARSDQAEAVEKAQREHMNDGAESVVGRDSSRAQNAALDKIQADLENPTELPIETFPKGKT